MSGGSHDYLCFVTGAGELAAKREALQRMADDLAGLPYARAAAVETQRLLDDLTRLDARIEAAKELRDVWHAVEWWSSGDYGEGQVRDAIAEYENG